MTAGFFSASSGASITVCERDITAEIASMWTLNVCGVASGKPDSEAETVSAQQFRPKYISFLTKQHQKHKDYTDHAQ